MRWRGWGTLSPPFTPTCQTQTTVCWPVTSNSSAHYWPVKGWIQRRMVGVDKSVHRWIQNSLWIICVVLKMLIPHCVQVNGTCLFYWVRWQWFFLLCSVADDEFKQYTLMYMYFPFELIDSFDELQEEPWCMTSSMTSSFPLLKWWWTVWTPVMRRSWKKSIQSKKADILFCCLIPNMKCLYNIHNSTTFTGKNYNDKTKLSFVCWNF